MLMAFFPVSLLTLMQVWECVLPRRT
jgi:hypothetical protein